MLTRPALSSGRAVACAKLSPPTNSVIFMEINEARWLKLQGLASARGRIAPKAVVVALGSILEDPDSAAVWATVDTTPSSTAWYCWTVTDRFLGEVLVEYQHNLYDQDAERFRELAPSAWAASVRPLDNVTRIQFGPFYAAQGSTTIFEPAERITVTFTDGEVRIPQGSVQLEQRVELGQFVKALRTCVNL